MQDDSSKQEVLVDDAALWKKNRELEIEEYTVPEQVPDGFIDVDEQDTVISDEPKHVTATDVRDNLNMLKLAQPTAGLCVSIIDIVLPALAFWIVGAEKSDMKLDADEKDTLQDAFANYLKDKNLEMSPGGILLMTIAAIYTPKIIMVRMSKKKANEKTEADETETKNGADAGMRD